MDPNGQSSQPPSQQPSQSPAETAEQSHPQPPVQEATTPATGESMPQPKPAESGESYTWQASEFIFHEKPAGWYMALWLIVAVSCGLLVLLKQWTSAAVVAVAAVALMVYSRKQPRTLDYHVDQDGITIDGKTNPYVSFKSYSVFEEVGWHEIDIDAAKRFVPRLTLICDSEDMPVIESILAHHLPHVPRHPDWIERATKYLRF